MSTRLWRRTGDTDPRPTSAKLVADRQASRSALSRANPDLVDPESLKQGTDGKREERESSTNQSAHSAHATESPSDTDTSDQSDDTAVDSSSRRTQLRPPRHPANAGAVRAASAMSTRTEGAKEAVKKQSSRREPVRATTTPAPFLRQRGLSDLWQQQGAYRTNRRSMQSMFTEVRGLVRPSLRPQDRCFRRGFRVL